MSVALLIGLGLLASFDAYACIPSDRYQSSGDYALEDENGAEARAIYYYIQSDFGTRLSHCTPTPEDDSNPEHWVRRVIQGAAEHWNTNAQGIPLLYGGTVPTDLPPDACLNHMIKRPAIFVRLVEGCDLNGTTMCQNTLASVRSIFDCSDAVTLTIYANRNQNPNLSVSDCSAIEAGSHNYAYGRLLEFGGLSNRINLRTLFNHEFGHGLNMGHSENDSPSTLNAVMTNGSSVPTGVAQQAWDWDETCSDQYNLGRNQVFHTYRSWRPAAAHSETLIEQNVTMSDNIMNSYRAGGHLVDGGGAPYYPVMRTDFLKYSYVNSDGILNFGTTSYGGHFAASSSVRSPVTIFTPHELSSGNAIRMNFRFSFDSFPVLAYQRRGTLSGGSWVTGGYKVRSGSSELDIQSHRPMAVTWDPAVNKTIFSWVHSNRTSVEIGGEIEVSAGFYGSSQFILAPKVRLSSVAGGFDFPAHGSGEFDYLARTNVSPAIACGPVAQAGTFNCILAWLDRGIPSGRILYTYFHNSTGNPVFYKEGGKVKVWAMSNLDSVTAPTAAFFNNTFHIAVKRASVGWSLHSVVYGYRTSGLSTWTVKLVPGRAVDSPTYLYKNGSESALVWTQLP